MVQDCWLMELSYGAFVCPAGLGSADPPFLEPVDWLRCPSMTAAEAQEGSGESEAS